MIRALVAVLLLAPTLARAEEAITAFDVAIAVEKSGDIRVAEKIAIRSEGYEIQRGIYRDLPRWYEKNGGKLPYRYDVISVTRNGGKEPYAVEREAGAYRIRIGDADVLIEDGAHRYEIVYAVRNQVRYFDGYDEIYWNATGNYWTLPIARASATISLPGGAGALQRAGYTGPLGASGDDYRYSFGAGAHHFATTKPLAEGEGLTVAVGFAKGVVDLQSTADARGEWWAKNLSQIIIALGFVGVGGYYLAAFQRIGRDPPKSPVFPRYEAPAGHSPAAIHYIYHRGLSGHDALIATLVNLGVKKRLKIDVGRKRTQLRRLQGSAEGLDPIDVALEGDLLSAGEIEFGGKVNTTLTSAYGTFRKTVAESYGRPYFRWNRIALLFALALSAFVVWLAARFSVGWTMLDTAGVAALAAMGVGAAYFLPAPTKKGQDIRTEIEGFKLYLKTAEELQLNAAKVGSEAPPPMTVERYERFLPYAIALGVERPWTKHFERLMPKEAAGYAPYWGASDYRGGSVTGLNSALVSGLTSGVSSAMPQSSSSSGSGGGGSSGGGGGGGGGGGW